MLTIFASSDSQYLTVTANSGDSSITVIPDENWNGNGDITVIVSDGELSDTQTFTLTINPVNDAPIISPAEDQVVMEDEIEVFSFEVTDIDTGETFELSVFSDTSSVLVFADSENLTITASPVLDWNGTTDITTIVSDGELTDTTIFVLTVNPVNDAPIISSIETQTVNENIIFIFYFITDSCDYWTVVNRRYYKSKYS